MPILYKTAILKIEMEKARRRQIEAGKLFGKLHPKQEVRSKLREALSEEQGKAMEKAAKKVGLALTILKIEMEKAKRRQAIGHFNAPQYKGKPVPSKLTELDEEQGEAIEIVAKKVGLGKDTL